MNRSISIRPGITIQMVSALCLVGTVGTLSVLVGLDRFGLDSYARDFARLSAIVSECILYLPHLQVRLIFHCFVICMLTF